MGKASRRRRERREARAAAAATVAPNTKRAWIVVLGAALILVAGAGVLAAIVRAGGDEGPSRTPATAGDLPAGGLPGLQTGQAPWPAEQDLLTDRVEAVGIPFSATEGGAVHIHPTLSIVVDGEPVAVPTDIGISPAFGGLAALHTHDEVGTIHVESPIVRDYSLGEFFDVWGVRLTRRCLGGYCTGRNKQLRAFVDGKPIRSNPRAIELADKQQILLVYGTAAQVRAASRASS
jgi:hypothetical protein